MSVDEWDVLRKMIQVTKLRRVVVGLQDSGLVLEPSAAGNIEMRYRDGLRSPCDAVFHAVLHRLNAVIDGEIEIIVEEARERLLELADD